MMHLHIPGKLCKGCQREIGREEYVVITDKITRGLHTFHTRCQPKDPDLQRHHGAFLLPGRIGIDGAQLR